MSWVVCLCSHPGGHAQHDIRRVVRFPPWLAPGAFPLGVSGAGCKAHDTRHSSCGVCLWFAPWGGHATRGIVACCVSLAVGAGVCPPVSGAQGPRGRVGGSRHTTFVVC
eukprot:3564920-Alexandrium_andersonii.AAC.1